MFYFFYINIFFSQSSFDNTSQSLTMTSIAHIVNSLERLFLGRRNVSWVSNKLGYNALEDMKKWAQENDLDDFESIQMDYSEALDYANKQFMKTKTEVLDQVTRELYMTGTSRPEVERKYPKAWIPEGTFNYTVADWRNKDAYVEQEVFRTNANFRYKNKIKSWQTHLHTRHFDRDPEMGRKDTRSLETLVRGYDMEAIHGPNPYRDKYYDYSSMSLKSAY